MKKLIIPLLGRYIVLADINRDKVLKARIKVFIICIVCFSSLLCLSFLAKA